MIDNNNAKEFSQPVFADQYLLLTTLNHMYAYVVPAAEQPRLN